MNLLHILLPCAAYLIGSIPFGLLLSRRSGIDIRQQGSGNIGATNVTRLLGKKIGLLTLMLDVVKGWLPMFLAALILKGDPQGYVIIALCGAAAVIGHTFSLFLRGKGGKGVATGLGVFLYLAPKSLLVSVVLFIAILALFRFVSLASLIASAAMLPSLYLFGEAQWKLWLACFVVLLIWMKHRANIKRLVQGTEKTLGKRG